MQHMSTQDGVACVVEVSHPWFARELFMRMPHVDSAQDARESHHRDKMAPYPIDDVKLRETFEAFDADHSGMVSGDEIKAMALSLGIVISEDELEKMIKEADQDGNNEIDFDEFKNIFDKAMAAETAGKGFGALAVRKNNAGPSMKWRADKMGPGISIEGDVVSRAASQKGHGVQLLDVFCHSAGYDAASALFEVSSLASGSFIGVVGSNFQRGEWDEAFDETKHAAAVNKEGIVFCKGQNLAPMLKLSALEDKCFVQLNLNMQEQELTMYVLDKEQHVVSNVTVQNLPVEVCGAVSFGPSDKVQSVKLIGSSTEKSGKKISGASTGKDVWDDSNVQKNQERGGRRSSIIEEAAVAATMM